MTMYILINLLIGLLVLWIIYYVINRYLPVEPPLKTVVNVILAVIGIIWLLRVLHAAMIL